MSKSLEALKRNRDFIERYFVKQVEETGVYHKNMKDEMFNDLSIIEKELKRLEDFDSVLNTGGGVWAVNGFVAKKLRAFEILKEKQIDVLYIAMSHSLEQYNKHVSFIHNEWCLTQEEFDLLKEVLYEKETA